MLVVMQRDATATDIERVCAAIREMGFQPLPMPGEQRTAIGLVGNDGHPTTLFLTHFTHFSGYFGRHGVNRGHFRDQFVVSHRIVCRNGCAKCFLAAVLAGTAGGEEQCCENGGNEIF